MNSLKLLRDPWLRVRLCEALRARRVPQRGVLNAFSLLAVQSCTLVNH